MISTALCCALADTMPDTALCHALPNTMSRYAMLWQMCHAVLCFIVFVTTMCWAILCLLLHCAMLYHVMLCSEALRPLCDA